MNEESPGVWGGESWDAYRVFLAVVQAGTLSAAASSLGLSQPTVGRRISALEGRLGVRLFERRPEGLRPTAAARRALPRVRRLAEEAALLQAELRGEDESLARPVRIATTATLGTSSLTGPIAALRALQPKLRIELSYGLGLVDLLRGEADVVLRQSRPGSPELVGRRIAKIGIGLWASDTYLARSGAPRRRGDLGSHATIEASGELERIPGSAWLRAARGRRVAAIRCSELLGVAALARAGLGLAVLPRYVAEAAPALRRVLPRQASWEADLWLLTRRELRSTRRVRIVLDHLAEAYRGARL